MTLSSRARFHITPLEFLLLLGAAILAFYEIAPLVGAPTGHDQAWYLIAAQRLLSGAKLYGPEIAETNPPLVVWFSTVPVLVSRWVPVVPSLALRIVVLLMVAGSVAWCLRLLRRNPVTAEPLAWGLLAWTLILIELRLQVEDFGQREHLFVILALPYILAVTTRNICSFSNVERIALGVTAAIGICFKPQYALVVAALEIFLAIYARNLRRARSPEFVALLLIGVAYVSLVRLLTPLYGRQTVPLLLDTYWAYGTSTPLELARSMGVFTLLAAGVLVVCIVFRRFLSDATTPLALLICSLAATVAYDIQRTSWIYHEYPHRSLLRLAELYLIIDLLHPVFSKLKTDRRLNKKILLGASFIVILLGAVIYLRVLPRPVSQPPNSEIGRLLSQYKPSTTVYIFSTNVSPISEVYDNGLNWGSRFPCLWLLPAIIRNEDGPIPADANAPFKRLSPQTIAMLTFRQRTETTEDLVHWKPSLVLVEHCRRGHFCQALHNINFDILPWFLQNPEFAAIWSQYKKQQELSSFDVYVRAPNP